MDKIDWEFAAVLVVIIAVWVGFAVYIAIEYDWEFVALFDWPGGINNAVENNQTGQ